MFYSIGEMANLVGLSASALRYYDKLGLLPFVERTESGIRVFKDEDFEWLQVIECLKKTGMPLEEIKDFIHMAMEGDSTVSQRLELITKQREIVKKQLEDVMLTLDILDYKCWYYEKAKEKGTTSYPKNVPDEELCEKFVRVRKHLKKHK